MEKRAGSRLLTIVNLDRTSPTALYQQLYEELRHAILTQRLKAGHRLPSSRSLAQELNLSRNTVLNALEQLTAEGYLDVAAGSGTYVARVLPDDLATVSAPAAAAIQDTRAVSPLSEQGRSLAPIARVFIPVLDHQSRFPGRAFQIGAAEVGLFPREIWSRLLAHHWRDSWRNIMTYNHPAGYRPLRESVAGYLGASRGVRCTADQVIIVTGSQQAISLTARLLIDPGDTVCIEDPGYLGARAALLTAGARIVPVPVDSEGLDVAECHLRCPQARLAFVTPSHQFPLGMTMTLPRRLALLDWAERSGAWILEDDYDSEFRYTSRPLAALYALDGKGCVIYSGTFSKVLFPGLRLGYLVVPPGLVDAFTAARLFNDMHSPILEQAALTDFIDQGHFARHIRRMRALYAERQETLLGAAFRGLAGRLTMEPADSGMHLVGWLNGNCDDRTAAEEAAKHGVDVGALSQYAIEPTGRPALLLGYAGVDTAEIHGGVSRLAAALATLKSF